MLLRRLDRHPPRAGGGHAHSLRIPHAICHGTTHASQCDTDTGADSDAFHHANGAGLHPLDGDINAHPDPNQYSDSDLHRHTSPDAYSYADRHASADRHPNGHGGDHHDGLTQNG
jgi:hypothetical protein